MKHIIEAFSVLVVLVLNLCLCIGMITVSADVAAAKEWKADVIAEIENSDFNPRVIDGCKEQAAQMGYVLEVNTGSYNGARERCVADVRLTYDYKIPLLGISKSRVMQGIAR